MILALEHWRHHLSGFHINGEPGVEIYTDHLPLVNLGTLPANPRRARWSERLTPFNYVIKWKKGSTNKKADALSRKDQKPEETKNTDIQIIPWERIDGTPEEQLKVTHGEEVVLEIELESELAEAIHEAQHADEDMRKILMGADGTVKKDDKGEYNLKNIGGKEILTFRDKIVLPDNEELL